MLHKPEITIRLSFMSYTQFKAKLHQLLWCSDMITTRISLAIASLTSGIFLLFPSTKFYATRESYYFINQVIDQYTLSTLFITYALITIYQLLKEPNNKWYVTLNSVLGCTLWTGAVVFYFAAKIISTKGFNPSLVSGASIAMFFAAWWQLTRVTLEKHCNAR